jgi:hypothetical protein
MALKLKFQLYDDEIEPESAQNIYSIDVPLGESLPDDIREELTRSMAASMDELGQPINPVTSLVLMSMVFKGLMSKVPPGMFNR